MAEHGGGVAEPGESGAWYRTYVVTWVWLLLITALEIGVFFGGLARALFVSLLVILALLKAVLIAAYFMHLRYERLNLIYTIALPLILILLLFLGVARDAVNVFDLRR